MSSIISFNNVSYRVGSRTLLDAVNFDIHLGEFVYLVGKTGVGKSTLLKALVGLVPVQQGQITWQGQATSRRMTEFAYVPQHNEIQWSFPLTVEGVVELGRYPALGPFRRFGKKDQEAVDAAVDRMGLNDLRHRQIGALSGGQQQRTFLARAIAQEAHVFLLDEPFVGLDPHAQEQLSGYIHELADGGALVLASHHDMLTVQNLFSRAILLNRGIIADGEPATVLTEDHLLEAMRS